jgi:hypothetical protein
MVELASGTKIFVCARKGNEDLASIDNVSKKAHGGPEGFANASKLLFVAHVSSGRASPFRAGPAIFA